MKIARSVDDAAGTTVALLDECLVGRTIVDPVSHATTEDARTFKLDLSPGTLTETFCAPFDKSCIKSRSWGPWKLLSLSRITTLLHDNLQLEPCPYLKSTIERHSMAP